MERKIHRLNSVYERDEAKLATYILEMLYLSQTEKVDAVFVNAFARYDLPHRAEPEFDVDMALGIKQAFNIITDFYQRRESE